MKQTIVHVALVVREYDEALDFYLKMNFELVEDTYQPEQDKRWVVVRPPGSENGTTLLLARATPRSRSPQSVTRLAGGYFSSSIPMISGGITIHDGCRC